MAETCPNCWTIPALDGSCCCEQPVKTPPRVSRRSMRPVALDAPRITANDPPAPITSRKGDLVAQLRDLPDLAAHLALRATTSAPGVEPGSAGDPAYQAPANLAVLHILDQRRHGRGDDVPRLIYADQQHYQCAWHGLPHNHSECPVEADDDGTTGLLPALCQWADMIAADLDGREPGADSPPPTDPDDPALTPTWASVCDWLARHVTGWAAVNPEAEQLLRAGVGRWHARLRAELGEHEPVPLYHRNLGGCGGKLLPLADGIRHECADCHEVLTPGEMLGLARWQADVTAGEAAAALGVPVSTVKWRIAKHELRPVDDRYPARYPLREVARLCPEARHAGA